MKRVLAGLLAFSVAAPLAALAAPGKEKVKLERRIRQGLRSTVKEREQKDMKTHWKGEGGDVGGLEAEDVEREYEQEVVNEKPLIVKRSYKKSTRLKRHPKDPNAEPQATSVQGRTVTIGPDGPKIDGGGEMSKEDRENLSTLERIVYACLPAKEVATGEDWRVPGNEIVAAVFGGALDARSVESQAIGKLKELVAVKGARFARMQLRVQLKVKPTETLPLIELDLKGTANFAVDDGVFTAFELEGPFLYEGRKVEDGRVKGTWTGEGTTHFVYKVDVLGRVPEAGEVSATRPTGPKDEDLAKAKQLTCPAGHKLPVFLAFCPICGEKLDETTKLCPKKCPFFLRHCPACGGATAPSAGE